MTHGTASGYAYHGCRCRACTRAQRERVREYRKARMTSDSPATNPGTTEKCPGDVGASPGVAPRSTPLQHFEQYPAQGGRA